MAALDTQHRFNADVEQVFRGISRFSDYPDHLPGVTATEILPPDPKATGSFCQVRYELSLIKTFYYVLNMYQDAPQRLWWDLAASNLMKANSGSWELAPDGDGCLARYRLDVAFKGLVPSAVTDRVAKANVPAMMAGFDELVATAGD